MHIHINICILSYKQHKCINGKKMAITSNDHGQSYCY